MVRGNREWPPAGTRFEALRLEVAAAVGRFPRAYYAYQRVLGKSPDTLVTSETDLCVEGAPGSGNTFFVEGLLLSNPGLRLAHHHHVAAPVRRALALEVPIATLLRHPIDCVLSKFVTTRHEAALVGPGFRQWIAFWSAVDRLGSRHD